MIFLSYSIMLSSMIILIIVFLIILYFYKKRHDRIDDVENKLDDLSSSLFSIEKKLSDIQIQLVSLNIDSNSSDIRVQYNQIIDLAKGEIDRSIMLIENIYKIVKAGKIQPHQLEKLITISNQIKTIKSIMSADFIS